MVLDNFKIKLRRVWKYKLSWQPFLTQPTNCVSEPLEVAKSAVANTLPRRPSWLAWIRYPAGNYCVDTPHVSGIDPLLLKHRFN